MANKKEIIASYDLIVGEDTYATATAQDPRTARRLKSLIPTGKLEREAALPKYLNSLIDSGAPVMQVYQYAYNDAAGAVNRKQFAATSSKLFMESGGAWVEVLDVGTLAGIPVFWTLNNLMHMSDGTTSWLYDGPNATWVKEGFPLPLWAAASVPQAALSYTADTVPNSGLVRLNNVVTAKTTAAHALEVGNVIVKTGSTDASFDGTFSIVSVPDNTHVTWAQVGVDATSGNGTIAQTTITNITNIYYWHTFADHTTGRVHESSTSPISAATGALAAKVNRVYQNTGTVSSTIGTTGIAGVGTAFDASMVGMKLYIDGTDFGLIASVTNATALVLAASAPSSKATKHYVIAPPRATHWHIYRSESENSKVGMYLTAVPVTTMYFDDQSPFLGTANSQITRINRPLRNDPAPGSTIAEVHKYRVWRERKTRPNFFFFSANEEVAAGANGAAQESYPGTDTHTQSDVVNENPLPDTSNRIRGFVAHGEALYIGSEKQVVPLYGQSIDDFALSQVTIFSKGFAGRFGGSSTAHGLAFITYDRKGYLYPAQFPSIGVDATSQLVEIGKALRTTLATINFADLDNVRTEWYSFSNRDWWVVSFKDNSSAYRTFVYDFENKGWFELQRGFTSLAVFEVSAGKLVLVGGGTDGYVYVIDDVTGTYSSVGALPAALWRPALIDFGAPNNLHLPQHLELEFSNSAIPLSFSAKYYLDPEDVDAPTNGISLTFAKMDIGSNRWRAFFTEGVTCKRLLLEFNIASDTNAGDILSVKLTALRLPENL